MPLTRDFDLLWDYDKPAETEAKFVGMLDSNPEDKDYRLELLTQIARCKGLQRQFPEAHSTLDEVEAEVGQAQNRVKVRYLLERGRAFNSTNDRDTARVLFTEAWELAQDLGEDFFAVDAAHMIAIAGPPHSALEWNEKAVALAEASEDDRARNWLGSLYNNIGWTYHDQGQYAVALKAFEKALEYRVRQGKRDLILVGRWCIGRCLRSLGRFDEALEIQRELLSSRELHMEPAGYVNEEIGECLLAMKNPHDAAPFFAAAFKELSVDPWFSANEKTRLERMRKLSIG